MLSALGLLLGFAISGSGALWAPLAYAGPPDENPWRATASPDEIATWQGSVVMLVTGPAWCSGVLIDDQGTVATAYHCVASGLRPKVSLRDGRSGIGKTIAAVPREDLALVSVPELAGAPPRPVRTDAPLIGERVYGLGHPYAPLADRSPMMEGMLLWSVSEGIISAVGPYLIQTDAALNPGNSGGPILDVEGRVVGITSRKLGGDNLAFAARSSLLDALVSDPGKFALIGGSWTAGFSLMSGLSGVSAESLALRVGVDIRERLVAQLSYGLPLDARARALSFGEVWYPAGDLTAGVRQRFGRGKWSTAVDAGGGLYALGFYASSIDLDAPSIRVLPQQGLFGPGVYGRVETGGFGLRVSGAWADGQTWMTLAIDVETPGSIGNF